MIKATRSDLIAKCQDAYHYLLCASGNHMTDEESTFCSTRDFSLIGRLERYGQAIEALCAIADMAHDLGIWSKETPSGNLFAALEDVMTSAQLQREGFRARRALRAWCNENDIDAFRGNELRV